MAELPPALIKASAAGFENFFLDLAAADREGTGQEDAYARISKKYEITWL